MYTRVLISVLVLSFLLASCNMPAGQTPAAQLPDVDAVGTAVELTAAAKFTEMAGSAPATFTPAPTLTAAPTQCSASVTSTVDANVRSGPGTAYEIVGALPVGQSALIVGRNDVYSWWYISYPSAVGGHAWIAGSVVTSSCVPASVQVVAAPDLPTEDVVEAPPPTEELVEAPPPTEAPFQNLLLELSSFTVDLVAVGMQFNPEPAIRGRPVDVDVKVENQGTVASASFTIQWWAKSGELGCQWNVPSLAAGESVVQSCSYTYSTSLNQNTKLVVDPGNAVVESNEDNNVVRHRLSIHLH